MYNLFLPLLMYVVFSVSYFTYYLTASFYFICSICTIILGPQLGGTLEFILKLGPQMF
jgi:hypothetical protein